jgi:peptide/nickel transport system permease protein
MLKYIVSRLAQLILVLFGVSFLTFFVTVSAPGDAAEMSFLSMGIEPTSEQLAKKRAELGLDKPYIVQYVNWLKKVLNGDFGESFQRNETVMAQFKRKLPGTMRLAGVSMIVMTIVSFPLGILSAVKKNRTADYIVRFVSFFGISMPNFWLGLILVYIFSVRLGWFRVIGNNDFKSMILPVAALTIPLISRYARQIRSAMLEELAQEYVVGALARGVKEWKIIWGHVLPNAILPIITLLGLSIGHLLGGAAIVETIFSWQGIGSMVVEAIRMRDYPMIQAYVMWMAAVYVTANLIVDISCRLLDPKSRFSAEEQ